MGTRQRAPSMRRPTPWRPPATAAGTAASSRPRCGPACRRARSRPTKPSQDVHSGYVQLRNRVRTKALIQFNDSMNLPTDIPDA
jgi:hypothetical protein